MLRTATMRKKRNIAAVLTPPDVISQIALGVPLYLLFEVSIQVSRLVARKSARKARTQ